MTEFLSDGPQNAGAALILSHGAGAPMDSAFMEAISGLLAGLGVRVLRFEFAYMAARRSGGTKRPPPRAEKLMAEYSQAIALARAQVSLDTRLFIGGKSMGGRVASLIADEAHRDGNISGLVCLGYPFHPPGKPDRLRTAHLEAMATRALICQGERDPFGTSEDVAAYKLSPTVALHWLADGNHDLVPRKASGRTGEDNWGDAAAAIAAFMGGE